MAARLGGRLLPRPYGVAHDGSLPSPASRGAPVLYCMYALYSLPHGPLYWYYGEGNVLYLCFEMVPPVQHRIHRPEIPPSPPANGRTLCTVEEA